MSKNPCMDPAAATTSKNLRPSDETLVFAYVHRGYFIRSRASSVARFVQSMQQGPFTRRRYKDTIESHLTGPFFDFLQMSYEAVNGVGDGERRRWICDRLTGQVEYEFSAWVIHPIRGFTDRENAICEALQSLRTDEAHNRRVIAEVLRREHNISKVRHCPKNTVDCFFKWIEHVVSAACSSAQQGNRARAGRRVPEAITRDGQ